jgi:hypothetical protein
MFESEFLAEVVGGIWEKKGPICFLGAYFPRLT